MTKRTFTYVTALSAALLLSAPAPAHRSSKKDTQQSTKVSPFRLSAFSPFAKGIQRSTKAFPLRPLFAKAAEDNGEQRDEHGIIVSPAEGLRQVFTRSGWSYINDDGVQTVEQSGTMQVVTCDDGTIYIRNILASYPTGTWVKGQADDDGTITIPTRQPIYYNALADCTYSVGWAAYDSEWGWFSNYDSYSDVITFKYDSEARTLTLQDSSPTAFIALLWDDDDTYGWHGDYQTVCTYDSDFVPLPVVSVSAPETLQGEQWFVHAHARQDEDLELVKGSATVGFSGPDVYLKGVFPQLPDAWMKGTLSGDKVTFGGLQTLGTLNEQTVYAVGSNGGDLVNFTMTYDASHKQLRSDCALLANTSTTDIQAVAAYEDIAIQLDDPYAPIETLPYANSISTQQEWEWFTVVDANADGTTWHRYGKYASYEYNSDNQADDWLITPAFRLKGGHTYSLAIDAFCSSDAYTEQMEVKMGTSTNPDDFTAEVIPSTGVDSEQAVTLRNKRISVSADGAYYFGFHVTSPADQASLRLYNLVVDETILTAPAAVGNLTVTPAEELPEATVSFTAPTTTIGGDDLTDNLTKIEILRQGEVIATLENVAPGSTQTYVDNDKTLTTGVYSYQVLCYNANGKGDMSEPVSAYIVEVLPVPFYADFKQDDTYSLFTVIDANEDYFTWEDSGTYAEYSYNAEQDADDYLVSPALHLEAGKSYSITVSAGSGGYPERFDVVAGRKPTVQALSTKVIEGCEVTLEDDKEFEGTFTATETGTYHVAVHCISEADHYTLFINSINVELGPDAAAPAAPSLAVEPGDKGAVKATLNVKAPTESVGGQTLTAALTIALTRDGQTIAQMENVAPGATVTYEDNDIADAGFHTWQAVASNDSGNGKKSEKQTVYVGIDKPVAVTGVKAADNTSSVLISWDAVPAVGMNGGYVDTDEVEYYVYACEPGTTYVMDDDPVATVKGDTSVTIDFATNEGYQQIQAWVVTANNEAGASYMEDTALTSLLIGESYELPMSEGFADGQFHYYADYVGLPLAFSVASDGDGTALALTSQFDDSDVAFTSGKISLEGATNPMLLVDVASFGATDFSVIATNDGVEAKTLATDNALGQSYKTVKVPLNSIQGTPYVMLGFMAHIGKASVFDEWTGELEEEGDAIIFDNIRIVDYRQHNIAVTLSTPEQLQAGLSCGIMATVTNWGEQPAKNYTLTVKAGSEEVFKEVVSQELLPFQSTTLTANVETTVFSEAGPLTITATADYSDDELTADNSAQAVIVVTEPVAPAPQDLTAHNEGGDVELDWTAPTANAVFTESFEQGMGGWTSIDADADGHGWKRSYYGENDTYMETNSGLAALYSESYSNDDQKALTPDNWLISPRIVLDGTFSFYAKGQDPDWCDEHFAVYVSTTDTNPESFTQVSEEILATANMTEYSTDLSQYAGKTGYVAIRHFNVSDMYVLVVDDVTYTMGGQPASYNIYLQGERIATTNGEATTFTAAATQIGDGDHTFAVSAVYANGQESRPVTTTISVVVGIEQLAADAQPADVYSLDGRLIRRQATSLEGLKGVYLIGNKTVMVK